MLSSGINRIIFWARTLPKTNRVEIISPKSQEASKESKQVADPLKQNNNVQTKDKFDSFHRSGPELEITKILVKNGPLTSRQIWRSYRIQQQSRKQHKQPTTNYFHSLHHLKKYISFMRANDKLKGSGYEKKKKLFYGWKIDEKRALKFVHPEVIQELEEFKRKRNQL